MEKAQRNIGAFRTVNGKRRRIDSSGTLRNSLGYTVVEDSTGVLFKFTSSVEYAVFIEYGVNGRESVYSTPFSFKGYENPSKKHVDEVEEWMKVKPIRIRDPRTGRFVPIRRRLTRDTKDGKKGEYGKTDYRRQAAFAIAYSIRKHGVAPQNFMSDAVRENLKHLEEVFAEKIEIEIFNRLED